MRHGRPGQGHHPLDGELARLEQPPHGRDVLVPDVPRLPVAAHRVEPVDVQARRARGMDAVELLAPEPVAVRHRHPAAGRRAHVDGAVGQPRQGLQAGLERPVRAGQHDVDPRGQGLGVDGGHEDGAGPRPGVRDPSEGPGPDGRPQARLEQQPAHVVAGEAGRMPAAERGEADRGAAAALLLVAAEGDHDGPEAPALAAVDGLDGARGGRREPHAGPLLVLEQQLAAADVVPLRDVHGGPEADVVVAQQGHPPGGPGGADRLVGLARDRQPQSLANGVSPHGGNQAGGRRDTAPARHPVRRVFHARLPRGGGVFTGGGSGPEGIVKFFSSRAAAKRRSVAGRPHPRRTPRVQHRTKRGCTKSICPTNPPDRQIMKPVARPVRDGHAPRHF